MAKLIHIVGTSGSGKTTIHDRLSSQLLADGYFVEKITEPGPLRDLAKSYRLEKNKNPFIEAVIFSLDRIMTYHALSLHPQGDKSIFLSARGFFDTVVYQGLLGGVPLNEIERMNVFVPLPDLTLAFIVDGTVGYRRLQERKKKTGEQLSKNEMPKKINQLAQLYQKLPSLFPGLKIHLVDTTNLNQLQTFRRSYTYIREVL